MKKIALSLISVFFAQPQTAVEFQVAFELSNQECKNAMQALESNLFIDQVSLNPGERFQWNSQRSHNTDGTMALHLHLKEDYDDFFKDAEALNNDQNDPINW